MSSAARRAASCWSWTHPHQRRCPSLPDASRIAAAATRRGLSFGRRAPVRVRRRQDRQEAGMNVRALVAEGVGTAFLMSSGQSFVLMLVVPWAFGLGLMAAIAIAGEASGGHFNPAVTLAAVLDGRMRWTTGLAYAVAQAIGAFAASLFILLVLAKEFVGATVNHPGSIAQDALTNQLHAFATEIMLTTIFVAVILTVTSRAPSRAIVVIPLTHI